MGWVVDIPVADLLSQEMASFRDGGYAALVFVIAREADTPDLLRGYLADWPSIHDLTGPYIAVLTPAPDGAALIRPGVRARGLALFGDETRDIASGPAAAFRPWVAGTLPGAVAEHAVAVTTVATQLQEYFGIAETMLPCAVVVCPGEQTHVAVALGRRTTVYAFLKEVKTELDPVLARVRQAGAEGERAARVTVAEHRHLHALRTQAGVRRNAESERREQEENRVRLAVELRAVDGDERATECRWFADRMAGDELLTDDESARAARLCASLGQRVAGLSNRERRSLLRRTRRVAERMRTPVPELPAAPADADLAAAETRAREAGANERTWRAALMAAYDEIDIRQAVLAGAARLGMVRADDGLLPWRQTAWPVLALARQPGPAVTTGRG
jgi:hypothetical protein